MRTLALFLCLSGCAYSVIDSQKEEPEGVTVVQRPVPEEPKLFVTSKDPDACVRQRFAADDIPYGFQYDPACPPDIYAPPRWIPPWDPGPIIK